MPDVLDCLANLSNDEVFTPPKVVNEMLDMLPQEIFRSKETTFLDPFTKTGVFLREITKRLLSNQVPDYERTYKEIERITKEAIQDAVRTGKLDLNDPDYEKKAQKTGDDAIKTHPDANRYLAFEVDLQTALDHILTKQVFGIAITELTADLARRSLYCSKDASGRFSITGTAFGINRDGNIRFVPQKHTWKNGTCIYCGASRTNFDRPDELESHAYEFIHTDTPEEILMGLQFTVICGNPPYQLGTSNETSQAKPIYNLFVEQAQRLNPKYLTMIIPSRWMFGGLGLDNFREKMLNDKHITVLHDFLDSKTCFTGVDIKGGVCYFLRDRDVEAKCKITTHSITNTSYSERYLKEDGVDVFIRQNELISIKQKVWQDKTQRSIKELMSGTAPYGLPTNFFAITKDISDVPYEDGYEILGLDGTKRITKYVPKTFHFSKHNGLGKWKIFIPKAYGCGAIGEVPSTPVIGTPVIGTPVMACTMTFIEYGCWDTEQEALNALSYLKTKFFRCLVSIKKQSQDATSIKYQYVPMQDFSKPWTDAELYEKYNLTQDEIDFIESMIKPME